MNACHFCEQTHNKAVRGRGRCDCNCHSTATAVSARGTDPDQSHDTVRSIAADTTLHAMILDVARYVLDVFDDQDLTEAIRARYGIPELQRNVVARARGLAEPSGAIVRLDRRRRPDRKVPTQHFTHWSKQP